MISKLFLKNKWLWIILITAFLVRIYNFSFPAFTFEESRISYRGYTLAISADDELGRSLPLIFNSLDDYQLPLVSYLSAGGQLLFGKGDFGARIFFIILGTLLVYLMYLVAKNLNQNSFFPPVSSLVVAFSPSLIFLSKTPNEAIVLTFIFTLLFYLLISKKNIWIMILIAVAALLASKIAWFVLPPFLIFTSFFYSRISGRQKLILVSCCIILVALTFALFLKVPQSQRSLRENNFPLFNAITIKNGIDKLRGQGLQSGWPPIVDRVLFNKSHFLTTGFLHWFSSISPSYYFGRLDNSGVISYSFIGSLSKVLIIPFVFGIFFLIRKGSRNEKLLLSFIPLLTFPSFFLYPNFKPDLLILTLPFIALITAYGFLQLSKACPFGVNKKIVIVILSLAAIEAGINIFYLSPEYKNTTNLRPFWIKQLTTEIVESSKTYNTAVSDDIAFDIVPFIEWYTDISPQSGFLKIEWPYKFRQYQLGNITIVGSDERFRSCGGLERMRIFASKRDFEKIEKDFQVNVEKRYKNINGENKTYLIEGVCI